MNNNSMVDHQAKDRYSMYEFDSVELICYFERLLVILHEKELTWVGRLLHKHHTCVIFELRISTSLKQRPLIWSATVSSYIFKQNIALIF
ncbi:hypothetical protein HanIR_Chr17g0895551 [Helianthus annuus]|nr:hypothetical protein HanIR_Chr17g0895551 [Helianthus annuus]